jgi:poly(A) polymerase
MTPPEARAAIYRLGAGVFRDRVWLAWAADPEAGAHWLALLALARNWVAPTFPLNGDDALAAGIAAGPRLGEALRAVEAHWIASDFTEDRGALLARLGALDRP